MTTRELEQKVRALLSQALLARNAGTVNTCATQETRKVRKLKTPDGPVTREVVYRDCFHENLLEDEDDDETEEQDDVKPNKPEPDKADEEEEEEAEAAARLRARISAQPHCAHRLNQQAASGTVEPGVKANFRGRLAYLSMLNPQQASRIAVLCPGMAGANP